MALTRSMGARRDATRGTTPIEVRKAEAAYWANPGVVAGGPVTLVTGTAGMAYGVGGVAQFVTSRGQSDGFHVFTNDGATTVACPAAPGSGLSRWDVIWVSHPAAGENSDTTSAPIFGVSSSAVPASSNPAIPSIPTGALELARNLMTSAAVTTLTVPGNTIAQTATVANLRVPTPEPIPRVTIEGLAGYLATPIIKGGAVTVTTNSAGDGTITFGTSFPSSLYSATLTDISPSLGHVRLKWNEGTSTRYSLKFRAYDTSGTALASVSVRVSFTAFGV